MNEPEVQSVLSSSQGNDNEFDSPDPIFSFNSSMVQELNTQNIPLRGHRDDGDLQTEPEKNNGEGNFRALLKFQIDTRDEILASHIGLCDKNASYISKITQNVIVQCCGDAITEKIFAKIKNTKYFPIMADEPTAISIKEQLAICIRYFDTTSYEITEKFFEFIDVVDVSGEHIARTILQELDRLNLDIAYCHCQTYDGGSNMRGKFKGVQERKHALKRMCETRWVEKHDAVSTFLDTLLCLPVVLETIYKSSESRGSNAFSLLHAIQSSEFLVSVVVLAEVFGLTLPLARKLQAEYVDVLEAMKLVEAILATLREQRYKITEAFNKIFKESKKLEMEMGTQINKPRTTNLQKNRSNFNSQTV
ncbi:hypothetical protein PR048_001848 [Dryococelus australis]|uniref:DUF4371 domain-containing protein n=1 Tax=Dryococelus australis TaxID=614101 RepID=A0ABQ9IIP1_9NEOP|nr:hypothetical protein PR048_001848 [Dryococelus australis]